MRRLSLDLNSFVQTKQLCVKPLMWVSTCRLIWALSLFSFLHTEHCHTGPRTGSSYRIMDCWIRSSSSRKFIIFNRENRNLRNVACFTNRKTTEITGSFIRLKRINTFYDRLTCGFEDCFWFYTFWNICHRHGQSLCLDGGFAHDLSGCIFFCKLFHTQDTAMIHPLLMESSASMPQHLQERGCFRWRGLKSTKVLFGKVPMSSIQVTF